MRVLVITSNYPSEKFPYPMAFVHARVKYYIQHGIEVEVLNFSSPEEYCYDEVQVKTQESLLEKITSGYFDIVVSHAPNIRHHLRFLNKYEKCFKKLILVIHGHEVMQKSAYFPRPYPRMKTVKDDVRAAIHYLYDRVKRVVVKNYLNSKLSEKVHLIFVSDWMRNCFLDNISLEKNSVINESSIIPNTLAESIMNAKYDFASEKQADFITIRPLDDPKYCVDVVMDIARQNPQYSFHIYGQGRYFDFYQRPDNVTHFPYYIEQNNFVEILSKYRAALMPTRVDSHGVLMCEMACYGIPLIVSDIPICHEMLDGFYNVGFINNDQPKLSAEEWFSAINTCPGVNPDRFSLANTIDAEIQCLHECYVPAN